MTNISLRSYTREIEKLIDNSQADQAVAHCRHILKSYPKCVDAYRLLGKAYLESQRYGDAADIFQRVLSSVPDDFVSHVGMSLIREDEGNLDQAIWHMERAFEVQPANSAIQGELRRLYGRRDGMEPPKIRLTRGALARMYARGELFQQAVAEIRNALAEDPNRLDLISLLASVYAQAGQKAEAVEMCNGLLRKLPYSLEGNRIMGEMLKDTDRVQDLQVYKRRLVALNPYFAHLSPAATSVERVPDQSVTIERLQWSPGMVVEGPTSQPEWAASLGVQLSGMTSEKDILPDWLMNLEESASETGKSFPTGETGKSASPFDNNSLMEFARETQKTEPTADKNATAATKPLKPSPEEAIPDWMKEAGWQPSGGEASEEDNSLSFGGDDDFLSEVAGESGLVEANIPDWLQAMAPADAQAQDVSEEGGDELAWLNDLQTEATDSLEETAADAEPAADWVADSKVEVPDWLKELNDEKPTNEIPPTKPLTDKAAPETSEPEEQRLETPLSEAETGELPQAVSPDEQEGKETVPDWLVEGMRGPDARVSSQKTSSPTQEEPIFEAGEDIPDWLRDYVPEDEPATEGESAALGQAPDWLESLTSKEEEAEQPAMEEAPTTGEAELEETLETGAIAPSESAASAMEGEIASDREPTLQAEDEAQIEFESSSEEETAAVKETAAEGEPPAWDIEGADDAFAWLESLAVKQGAEEALLLNPEERQEAPPDWVQSDIEAQSTESEAAEIPDWLKELGPQGAEAAGSDEVEAELPDWIKTQPDLQSSAAKVEEAPLEGETEGEAQPAEMPDWLQALEPQASEAEALESEQPVVEGHTPEMQAPEMQAPEIPAEAEQFEEELGSEAQPAEIPDWLQSLEPQASEAEALEPEQPEVEGQTPEMQAPEMPAEAEQFEAELEGEAQPAEIPDWLQALEPQTIEAEDIRPEQAEVESPALEMQGSEAQVEETPSEEETEGEVQPAEIPDWLQALEPQASEAEPIEPEPWEFESQAPVLPGEAAQFEQEAEIVAEPAEIPDWLQALEPQSGDELKEAPVEDKQEVWFSEGPPILGDTQPVKVQSSVQPATETPVKEGELPSETQEPEQETPQAEVETRLGEKDIAAEAWSEAELTPPTVEPEAEPVETQEVAPETAPEAVAEPIFPEEAAEEPVTAADEWQPEEGEAVPSEEVASMLSEMQESEDAFAWLEGLAIRQGADEALILNPEERSETPPEWVQAEIEEAEEEIPSEEAAAMETEAAPGEEQPSEWSLEPESEVGKEEISPEEAIVMEMEALAEEEQPAATEQPAASEQLEEGETEEEIPELPDWLQESVAESSEEAAWTPSTIERPLEKLDLNQASLAELERLPDIGFRMAQNIVNYRDTIGAFKAIDDLLNIPGLGPEILADIQDWLFVTPQAEEVAQEAATALPGLEISEGPAELMEARQKVASGDFEQAAQNYTQVIKSNQHLDAIIQDLQIATRQFPQAIYLWQTLGDAHLRAGQIQLALDAYNQAEKLLS
jgi:competence ComEA-like helix-hairpin-helix protein